MLSKMRKFSNSGAIIAKKPPPRMIWFLFRKSRERRGIDRLTLKKAKFFSFQNEIENPISKALDGIFIELNN
jgi:hypothetical protein